MKNLAFSILFFFLAVSLNAQVAIGKTEISSNFVSLEFGNEVGKPEKQKGLLLPWVIEAKEVNNPEPGTLIFDTTDKKVKYYKGGNTPSWKDLTFNTNGKVDTSAQDDLESIPTAKVSVGTPKSAPGILVLEDTNKAMILPLIDNYQSIVNPSPGMIAYDLQHDLLCVFNGTDWTFLAADEII